MDNDVFQFSADSTDYSAGAVADATQDTTPPVLADDSFDTSAVAATTHNPLDDAQSVTFDIAPNVTVDLGGFTMDDYLALAAQFGGTQGLVAAMVGDPTNTLHVGDGHFYV